MTEYAFEDKEAAPNPSGVPTLPITLAQTASNLKRPRRGLAARWHSARHFVMGHHPAGGLMAAIIISLGVLAVGVFFGYQGDVYQARYSISDAIIFDSDGYLSGLLLEGQVTSIDPDKEIISISWLPGLGCGSPEVYSDILNFDSQVPGNVCGFGVVDINYYVAENASSDFATANRWVAGRYSAAASNLFVLPGKPTDAWNAADQSFDTEIPFDLRRQLGQDKYSTTLAYPFDRYKTFITFLAARTDTNTTLPFMMALAQSSIPNWSVSSNGYAVHECTNVTMVDPFAAAPSFLCNASEADSLQRYVLEVTMVRAASTIAFVCLIWLTNWIITLVIVWATAKIVIFGSQLPSDLILVPITALFSLPAVRACMPDAPAFGSYMDVCGFLFNLTLISLCSAAVLVVGMRRSFTRMGLE